MQQVGLELARTRACMLAPLPCVRSSTTTTSKGDAPLQLLGARAGRRFSPGRISSSSGSASLRLQRWGHSTLTACARMCCRMCTTAACVVWWCALMHHQDHRWHHAGLRARPTPNSPPLHALAAPRISRAQPRRPAVAAAAQPSKSGTQQQQQELQQQASAGRPPPCSCVQRGPPGLQPWSPAPSTPHTPPLVAHPLKGSADEQGPVPLHRRVALAALAAASVATMAGAPMEALAVSGA